MANIRNCTEKGLIEYYGLADTGTMSLAAMQKVLDDRTAYYKKAKLPLHLIHTIIFTDPINSGRGRKLCEYIRTLDVGNVNVSEVKNNPNSKNDLEIFLFCPDFIKLKEWYEKEGRAKMEGFNSKVDEYSRITYRHAV